MSNQIATEAQERAIRSFTVYGTPVGKGRPRFRNAGKFVQTYTPEKTANYETLVKLAYQQEHGGEPLLTGALHMELLAYFPIPKSTSKKDRALMILGKNWHIKKPDSSNVLKAVEDALNGIAYADDSSICSMTIVKKYSDTPRVEIMISELDCN